MTRPEPVSIASRVERLPITSYQRRIFAVVATAWFFDSMDLGAMTFILGSIRAEFNLSPGEAGLLASASFVGMLLGAAAAGLVADRFGRAIVFQMSMILWGGGSFLCAASGSPRALAIFRLVLGIGMGMEFPIAQALLAEIIPSKQRGRYVALLEGFWPIGFVCSGLLSYLLLPVWGWRGVFVALGLPTVFVLVVRRFVPESPRWLESRGRWADADRVMSEIEARVLLLHRQPLPPPDAAATVSAPLHSAGGFKSLWQPLYAGRTAMLWALWFFALLGYYGVTTWLAALLQQAGYPVTKSVLYTALISLAGVPGFLAAAHLVEAWGRKPTCVATLLGSAVMAYLYGSAATDTGSQARLIGFGLGMQFFMFGMWSVLYAYTPELYPTRSRATGGGFASAAGRVGSLIGPSLVGVILPIWGQPGVFALGAASFALAAAVVLFFGVETKSRLLEELSP